ncbi:MAG: YgiQ family radical SAM protein [Desulfofustis sp.]|nr:YgiQ family radical SAM protein [Desulfofustis sp.]
MEEMHVQPLPVTVRECKARGWDEVDIVLVSGDAYVDHPSFGLALIGRLLASHGYRVALLPQPRYHSETDFQRFGRPRLFFGISGGNLDSIVANYSSNGKVRDFDAYSPGGSPWRSGIREKSNRFRPDRAVLIYANLARRAYPDAPIILGGIESSLRRFIHFDYKQNRLRGSHLSDAKADLLIYGMAERAVVTVAQLMEKGHPLGGIPGTCMRMTEAEMDVFRQDCLDRGIKLVTLPGWDDIRSDSHKFMKAERTIDRLARSRANRVLVQKQQASWIVQQPPSEALEQQEMDQLYELEFSRLPHPATPEVPAYEMIKNSVTVVRGCYGNCSFCAITRHQGPRITSRSIDSIVAEVERISSRSEFDGTITDLGGPTANLFGTCCAIGSCPAHDCLYPEICKNLVFNEHMFVELLDRVAGLDRINHLFISSGLRLELLLETPNLLEKLLKDHTPGNLKIAPEHTEAEVLALMHKEEHERLIRFVELFNKITRKLRKKAGLTPYIISAHPGCSEAHTRSMVQKMKRLGLTVRQFQDFTPTPGTLSTAMYVSGRHRDKDTDIQVVRNHTERLRQRQIIERGFLGKRTSATHRSSSDRKKKRDRR